MTHFPARLIVVSLIASLAVTASAAIGPPHFLTGGSSRAYANAVVAVGDGFLVGWSDFEEGREAINVTRVDASGNAISTTRLAVGWGTIALASDGTNVLAAWQVSLNSQPALPAPPATLAWLDASGAVISDTFARTDGSWVPFIAAGGGRFLVAWSDADGTHAETISPGGSTAGGGTLIDSQAALQGAAVWNGNVFVGVWTVESSEICLGCITVDTHGRSVQLDASIVRGLFDLGTDVFPSSLTAVPNGEVDLALDYNAGSGGASLLQIDANGTILRRRDLMQYDELSLDVVGGTLFVGAQRDRSYSNLYLLPMTPDFEPLPGLDPQATFVIADTPVTEFNLMFAHGPGGFISTYDIGPPPGESGDTGVVARAIDPASFPPLLPLPTVPQVALTTSGGRPAVAVSWTDVPGTVIYRVSATATDDPDEMVHQTLLGPSVHSALIENLSDDTPYRINFTVEDGATVSPPASVIVRTPANGGGVRSPWQTTATPEPGGIVHIQWTDRSSVEDGFVVQELIGSSWVDLVRTGANVTEADVHLEPGSHTIVVAAVRGQQEDGLDVVTIVVPGTIRRRGIAR